MKAFHASALLQEVQIERQKDSADVGEGALEAAPEDAAADAAEGAA